MALVLSIVHVLACILIIGVILLQSGKGGGMGAGFGGASAAATQLFGGRGAGNFLTRSTVGLAAIFMCTSLGIAYLSSRPNSLLDLSESSGREASDEDTIVEQGSGELIELTDDAVMLPTFRHPPQAAYILGPEKGNLSDETLARCAHVVKIPTKFCINVSLAGALVMYDRHLSMGGYAPRPIMPGGLGGDGKRADHGRD